MERRLWISTGSGPLYPNLFTLLVGPAGIGKGTALRKSRLLIKAVKELKLSPTNMSGAACIDALVGANRKIVDMQRLPPYLEYNSLFIHIPEFSTLLPIYESDLLATLTDLYDCQTFEEKKRTNKTEIIIPNPQFNMLAGTTPSYLNQLMPAGAWDQGFISRVIMVFSGERIIKDIGLDITEEEKEHPLWLGLIDDLQKIANLYGKIAWQPEAAAAMNAWHKAGGPPVPNHPKLQHYVSRRSAHLMKLCMVVSVSRGDDLNITVEDYQTAQSILLETEFYMGDIFKAMVTGGDSASMDEVFHYVFNTYMARKFQPLSQAEIVTFIQTKVPAHSVMRVLEIMVRGNMLEVTGADNRGLPLYKPMAKQLHAT